MAFFQTRKNTVAQIQLTLLINSAPRNVEYPMPDIFLQASNAAVYIYISEEDRKNHSIIFGTLWLL